MPKITYKSYRNNLNKYDNLLNFFKNYVVRI